MGMREAKAWVPADGADSTALAATNDTLPRLPGTPTLNRRLVRAAAVLIFHDVITPADGAYRTAPHAPGRESRSMMHGPGEQAPAPPGSVVFTSGE